MPTNFSWGIFTLFAWLVPHVSVEIGEYRRSLAASPFWTAHGGGDKGGTSERYENAVKHARRSAIAAIVVALLLISGTAAGVAVTTTGLDPNMVNIIEGGSLFMAAVVMGILSIKSARWIGVYFSTPWIEFQPVGRNTRMLGFNVYWSVSKQFAKAYFCLLPFYCGAGPVSIPVSAVAGIVAGFLIDIGIYLGRHTVQDKQKGWRRTFVMAFVLVVISSAFFAHGCYYVDTVWGQDRWVGRGVQLQVVTGVVWFFLMALIHGLIWWGTRRRLEPSDTEGSGRSLPMEHKPGTRDRLATSLILSTINRKKNGSDARSTAGIGAGSQSVLSSKRNGESQTVTSSGASGGSQSAKSSEMCVGDDEQAPSANGDVDEQAFHNEKKIGDPSPIGGVKRGAVLETVDEMGLSNSLERAGNEKPFLTEEDPDLPWCSLVGGKFCCRSSPDQEERTTGQKIITALYVILWVCIALGFVFFVIINIGAQTQVASTNALLPGVVAILYTGMDLGEVCAFDDKGAESDIRTFPSREDAHASGYKVLHCGNCGYCSTWENLRKEWSTRNYLAAESARCAKKSLGGGRQAVLECLQQDPIAFGFECSDCWTTDIECTKNHCAFIYLQSQFINKVGNFNVAPGEITSATCEEAHCEVDPAPGVAGFVRCSGATRRRMNIKSTIARPVEQQCTIVDVSWEDLFGPCCADTAEYYVDKAEREKAGVV